MGSWTITFCIMVNVICPKRYDERSKCSLVSLRYSLIINLFTSYTNIDILIFCRISKYPLNVMTFQFLSAKFALRLVILESLGADIDSFFLLMIFFP